MTREIAPREILGRHALTLATRKDAMSDRLWGRVMARARRRLERRQRAMERMVAAGRMTEQDMAVRLGIERAVVEAIESIGRIGEGNG